MADQTFQPGDVVQLKSGGPLMTIISVSETGRSVDCGWFADNVTIKTADFAAVVLKLVKKSDACDG